MRRKGSRIAHSIDNEFKKEKEWQRKLQDRKSNIMILGENTRNPLIIEERGRIDE